MPVPKEVRLKEPGQYRILGKTRHRLDSPAKVNGRAEFGIDARFPGMLTALVARSPVFGGRVKSFSAAKAKAVPGVKSVVQVPSGVAVVATDFWAAKKGRETLEITWDEGEWGKLSTPDMLKDYAEMAGTPGLIARKEGAPDRAYAEAAQEDHRGLFRPLPGPCNHGAPQLHASTTAGDRCDIRVGTQMQTE